jgi:2-polyprenyl-3-methyl-5-hydroxy-6-metoxy-1,4-benzoquinol methylase
MADSFTYQGNELELFRHAKNWKAYFSKTLKPFIHGDVLEAGAGIGGTTRLLNDGTASRWLLLEPDAEMSAGLETQLKNGKLPANCLVRKGTIEYLTEKFDTIIYIDVLEHIENDSHELRQAATLIKPGGRLLVLSPAFPFLFNPFDKAIGHFRRYTKNQLRRITPAGLILESCRYYDSAGFFAAAANKLLLRKKSPSQNQVLFWDSWLVPVSRVTDKLFFHSFGKSIIAIWHRDS